MPLILVIEYDPTQRLLTWAVLEKAGHHVLEAADGTQGLELARKSQPDLIVCDVMMPGLNGYQLVEALKLEPALSTIPVIMLTTMASRSHMRIGMMTGADDYLTKPFIAAELRDAVAALIAKRKQQRRQFATEFSARVVTALEEQKQALASQYEARLERELDARWSHSGTRSAELKYAHATLLTVDLFGSILDRDVSDEALGAGIRRVYQSARDALYVFGAKHLLPVGNDLFAVFADDTGSDSVKPRLQAVRAALGLRQAASAGGGCEPPAATIALHCGSLTLLHIDDPLHGSGSTLASGEAVSAVALRSGHARQAGWRVICTPAVIGGLAESVTTGRKASVVPADATAAMEAVELLALA